MLLGDPSIWPGPDELCAVDPCGNCASMPGPMCWTHFSLIPRPHQRAVKAAIAVGTVDDQHAAIARARERVQETVNRLRAAVDRVETHRY